MERFWSKVEKTLDCWLWKASKDTYGYGQFWFDGTMQKAYRVAFVLTYGCYPPKEIDHLCRNRACVNPAHLEVVSHKENTLRGISIPAKNAKKIHCPRGHIYDIIRKDGQRECRICKNECNRRYYRNRRGVA